MRTTCVRYEGVIYECLGRREVEGYKWSYDDYGCDFNLCSTYCFGNDAFNVLENVCFGSSTKRPRGVVS